MIVLKNLKTDVKHTYSYQQYEALENLSDYEPVAAIGIVQLYKSNGNGTKSPDLITDKLTAQKMIEQDRDLYIEYDVFDTFALKADFAERTLDGETYRLYMKELWESEDSESSGNI